MLGGLNLIFLIVLAVLLILIAVIALALHHAKGSETRVPRPDPQNDAHDVFARRLHETGLTLVRDVPARRHLLGAVRLDLLHCYDDPCGVRRYRLFEVIPCTEDARIVRWQWQGDVCVACGTCSSGCSGRRTGIFRDLDNGTNVFDIIEAVAEDRGLPASDGTRDALAEVESRLETMRARMRQRIQKAAYEHGEDLPTEPYRGDAA